jgi:hypothetical protein
MSNTSIAAPAIRRAWSASIRAASSTIGPARCVDEPRRRLHQGKLGAPDQASGAPAQDEMHRDDVRLAKQRRLVDESGVGGTGRLLGQVLAPGDHLHSEGKADARDFFSDVAQPDDRERFVPQV